MFFIWLHCIHVFNKYIFFLKYVEFVKNVWLRKLYLQLILKELGEQIDTLKECWHQVFRLLVPLEKICPQNPHLLMGGREKQLFHHKKVSQQVFIQIVPQDSPVSSLLHPCYRRLLLRILSHPILALLLLGQLVNWQGEKYSQHCLHFTIVVSFQR